MESKINILIFSRVTKKWVIQKKTHVPRLGDRVNLFYNPPPKVKEVIWYPDPAITGVTDRNTDVLVIVE